MKAFAYRKNENCALEVCHLPAKVNVCTYQCKYFMNSSWWCWEAWMLRIFCYVENFLRVFCQWKLKRRFCVFTVVGMRLDFFWENFIRAGINIFLLIKIYLRSFQDWLHLCLGSSEWRNSSWLSLIHFIFEKMIWARDWKWWPLGNNFVFICFYIGKKIQVSKRRKTEIKLFYFPTVLNNKGRVHLLSLILDCNFVTTYPPLKLQKKFFTPTCVLGGCNKVTIWN